MSGNRLSNHFLFWLGLVLFVQVSQDISAGTGGGKDTGDNALVSRAPVSFSPSVLLVQQPAGSGEVHSPSKAKAFILSFLLPGAGEYYAGSRRMSRIFFGTEIALWSVFFSLRTYGGWKKHDFQLFAADHAGVDPSGKNYQYYVNIETYENISDYNDDMQRQWNLNDLYPVNKQMSWQWDSDASRQKFGKLRIASDRAYQNSLFVLGGIVMNHIISGIDALRAARRREPADLHPIRVTFTGLPEKGFIIGLWKCF